MDPGRSRSALIDARLCCQGREMDDGWDVQKMNFSSGVKMYTLNVTSTW